MEILHSSLDLMVWRKNLEPSKVVGFVPTMGALHEGHISLIKRCVDESDISIVSIFINPKQFAENEDLDSYPKNIDLDLKHLKHLNVDAVFVPGVDDIYAKNDTLIVGETSLSLKLEGKSRPQFFGGVLTVVSKLFNLIHPSKTFFGQKDAQQLILIKKMVSDMKYSIDVVGCPTIREKNGLAMSSRNKNLTKQERDDAGIVYQSLLGAKNMLSRGGVDARSIKNAIINTINTQSNIAIDYVSVADLGSLEEIEGVVNNALISLAVYVRDVRLIDNIVV